MRTMEVIDYDDGVGDDHNVYDGCDDSDDNDNNHDSY